MEKNRLGRRKSIAEAESDLAIRKARAKLKFAAGEGKKTLADLIAAHRRKFKL